MDDAYRSTEDPYRNPDDPYRNPDDPYRSMDDPYRKTDDPYCATGERKANGRVAEKLLRLLELVAGETPAVPGFPGLFTHETARLRQRPRFHPPLPSPRRRACDGEGCDVLVGRVEVAEGPALGAGGVAFEGEHARRLAGGQGDVEGVERRGEPLPHRLQVSLLARPAVEERLFPDLLRQRAQHLPLGDREEALGDLHEVGHRLQELDVDADLDAVDEADQRQLVRVREVELQAARRQRRGEERLAARAVLEGDALRAGAQVGGEQGAQGAAADRVLPPVAVEAEAVRPRALVRGEEAGELLHPLRRRIEAHGPDVDLPRSGDAGGGRAGREAVHATGIESSAKSRATASVMRSLALCRKKWSPGSIRRRKRPLVCLRQASRSSRVTSSSASPPKAEIPIASGSSSA